MSVRLSPSGLGTFKNCPTCFWLEKNRNIKRPRGIYPSLPNGMDRAIKSYMDGWRRRDELPPELADLPLEGAKLYPDQDKLNLWRNWRTGLTWTTTTFELIGAIDDLLVMPDGTYAPFDYKTKGSLANLEDTIKYYQHQTNLYGLMLNENGLPAAQMAVFSYWSPATVLDSGDTMSGATGQMTFATQVITIPVDLDAAQAILKAAVECLNGPIPNTNVHRCQHCAFVVQRKDV